MNQEQFVARRQEQWQELARILEQMQGQGARRLPPDTVREAGRLYRRAASDLAYARTYFPDSPTVRYLNGLVAQAHTLIYAEEPQRVKAMLQLFWVEVPETIRGAWRPIVLATVFLLIGGLVGFFAILADPNLAEAIVPEFIREFAAAPREGEVWPVEQRALIGTQIMLNNIRVGVMAFGLGITLGIGTAVILFYNGLIVGGLAAHFHRAGLSVPFWALIVPHGALELMAIFLCGAGGFAMGWPIVAPGDLPRKEAAAMGARRAVKLVLGSLPFFVIAAVIEGWVTPMAGLSDGGKYLVGILTGLLGLAWWLFAGRGSAKAAPAP